MTIPIYFYDSYSRSKVLLTPVDTDNMTVRLYTCGPTVYNSAHIGNLRAYLWEDFLTRTLRVLGYNVLHITNITDVDDKTIRDSQSAGKPLKEFTSFYINEYFRDMDALQIHPASAYPLATDFIPQMQTIIQSLIENGYAYESEGSVYFKIASFPKYGNLSGRKNIQIHHHRIAADEYDEKEGFQDFALWKSWKQEDGNVMWQSPWGEGRPGWHIECSAMSMHYLGETIDIHCGGMDNLFPHHENEIAQSEAFTGKKFVNIWLHGEWLLVDGKKMSKSLGNFYTLNDLLQQGFSVRAFRHFIVSTHYRTPVNFTLQALSEVEKRLHKFDEFWYSLIPVESDVKVDDVEFDQFEESFYAAIADDLNTSKGLAVISDFMRYVNGIRTQGQLTRNHIEKIKLIWSKFDEVYKTLIPWHKLNKLSEEDILDKIKQRETARINKRFDIADNIREDLENLGILLEDTPKGTVWRRAK